MRKILNKIIMFAVCAVLLSCNDWLDVDSSTNVKGEELFSKPDGFYTAVNGVYRLLGDVSLYGESLTWGLASVIGNNYDESKLPEKYANLSNYAYDENNNKALIDPVWESGYSVIANCNYIIENIEGRDSSFFPLKQIEKDMILGEMLGVRAMMHFDLLRLFAPAPATHPSGAWMPYVTTYPCHSTKHLTVDEMLECIIRDLEQAKKLVAAHDTSTLDKYSASMQTVNLRFYATSTLTAGGNFFGMRGVRMNYCAVSGILARAYQYRNAPGDGEKAYRSALDMYHFKKDRTWFKWTDWYTMEYGNKYIKMWDDILFAGYNAKLYDICAATRNMGNYFCYKNYKGSKDLFGDELSDFRYKKFIAADGSSTRWEKNPDKSDATIEKNQGPLAPVIRMSEVYYIMCEYLAGTENAADLKQAKVFLKELKTARGSTTALDNLTAKDFLEVLYNDMTREFMSEGQTFFLYKRLNRPIYNGEQLKDMSRRWVLPRPYSEDAYSNL